MQMCKPHWNKLRDALKLRGLDGMIAKDGLQAGQQLVEGRPDPLMAAHNAIVGNALRMAGLAVMTSNDDGSERCPICYLKAQSFAAPCDCGDPSCTPELWAERFEGWINRAADDQLERIGHGTGQA